MAKKKIKETPLKKGDTKNLKLKKKVSGSKKGEKVEEYFELEKKGKTKFIKASGKVPEEKSTKKELNNYNRILRNFLIFAGIVFLIIASYYFITSSQRSFEHRNVEFKLIREGKLYFYESVLPIYNNNRRVDHHLYTRKDPRKIEKDVSFEGEIKIQNILVFDSDADFICDGEGAISIGNLVNFLSIIGVKTLTDKSAECDNSSRYTYVFLNESTENKVEQTGDSCYTLHIKDCEILDVTEKFLYEILYEMNKK
jgi:hypothetical protein